MAEAATVLLAEAVAQLQTALNRADRTAASALAVGTAEDLQILRVLLANGPTRVGVLARERCASVATVSARLDRLEHRGLIARERLPGDRRAVVAVLTEDGTAAASASRRERLAALDEVAPRFPTDQLARLTEALQGAGA